MKGTTYILILTGILGVFFSPVAVKYFLTPVTYLHLEDTSTLPQDTVTILYHHGEEQIPLLNELAVAVPREQKLVLGTSYPVDVALPNAEPATYKDLAIIKQFVLTRAEENLRRRKVYKLKVIGDFVVSFEVLGPDNSIGKVKID